MGVIRQRGRIWYVDYVVNGKRYKKRVGPFKKNAELLLHEIELKINKNELGFLPKDSDLHKLFQEFLDFSGTNNSPNTLKRYTAIVDNFKRYLAKFPHITKLSQLDTKIFEDYKTYRKDKGAKPKTINIEIQTLKSIMILAVERGYTNVNPAKNVGLIKVMKKEPTFLSKEQVVKLLANSDEWLRPIFYTFITTGMRKSELENLTWNDIDFERKVIKIRVKADWTPKTAERDIDISDGLMDVLLKLKKKAMGNLVFHDGEGKMIDKCRLRREFMRVSKKAGFPEMTKVHSLRHTFASHLTMKGADITSIGKLLGHSNIKTTMIYSHLAPGHLSEVVNKLDFKVK